MGNGAAADGKLAEEGLHVADCGRALGACGGVAHMPDGKAAGQGRHDVGLGEVVAHIAEALGVVEALDRVIADDAARLLSAMLQGMQAEGHEIRRVGNADHTEYATFFLQLVVVERVAQEWAHRAGLRIRGADVAPRLETGAAHVTLLSQGIARFGQFAGASGVIVLAPVP